MDKTLTYFSYLNKNSNSTILRKIQMLYLADWKHCLVYKTQLSELQWYYNFCGPYSFEFQKILENTEYQNVDITFEHLTEEEKCILDFVLRKIPELNEREFTRLVYSTYPVMKKDKYTNFDLPELAKEYLNSKNN